MWLFAGGAMQVAAARRIRELGLDLIVTDRDTDCPCARFASELVALDTFDVAGNLKAAERLARGYTIKAALTVAADCHETVAHVARRLGLPGVDPALSKICRFKTLTREVLAEAGVPQPRSAIVESLDEARRSASEIGLPVVVKATNNSGSRGLSFINDIQQLDAGAMERALEAGTTAKAIVEECLAPVEDVISEQSIETLWQDGRMYWLNWVDRLFRKDLSLLGFSEAGRGEGLGWGVELGHVNPAVHPVNVKEEVYRQVWQAGCAIGMDRQRGGHILKVDIMLTARGPRILELTPRLSGGWDSSASTPARGADFVGGAIALALGEPVDLASWHRYFEYRDPACFAAVVAEIEPGAQDCIGRRFAIGTAYERREALEHAFQQVERVIHVV